MAAGSADPPAPDEAQGQRYGILALARMRKDDGRALILYSHAEDGVEAAEAAAAAPAKGGEPA